MDVDADGLDFATLRRFMSKLEGCGDGGREGGAAKIFVSKGIADANRIRK